MSDIERLVSEIERLRAALARIDSADIQTSGRLTINDWADLVDYIRDIAREALGDNDTIAGDGV